MVEVSLTVGKLDASLALLLTRDHHLIEFPTILLPDGISAGSIVKITCDRDLEREKKEQEEFEAVQNEIFSSFGLNSPKAPVLKIKNITQTSCVLEWDPLEVGTASIKSLTLYRNKSRLGQIPNPLSNTTSKLSGLAIEGAYSFQLRLDTTAGVYTSNELQVTTHKMTDLSGITVCLGEINFAAVPFTESDIEESLKKMGAKDLQHQVSVDTTHFVCTEPSGTQWESALKHNIPVVRPEWIKACELERRIIGVRMFYLDADPSYLRQRDFWKQSGVANNHAEVSGSPEEDSRPDGNAASDNVSSNNVDDEASEVVPEVGKKEDEVQPAAPEAVVAASDENAPSNVNDKESEESKLDQKEEQLEAAPEEVVEYALPKEAVQDEQEKVALEEKVEGDNFEAAAHNDGASKDISESGEIHTEDHAAPEAAEQNDLPEESPAKLAQEALKEDIDEAAPQLKETAVDEFSERAQSEGAQLEESPLEEVESEGGQLEESPLEEAPLEDVSLETAPLEDVPLEETSVDASVKELLSESAAEEKLETIPRSESPDEEEPFEEDSNTVSQPQQNNKSKSKNKKNKNKKK